MLALNSVNPLLNLTETAPLFSKTEETHDLSPGNF
jgi:hypothetical protein